MRMAAPDIVLFAVGLLLFSGASYAIVTTGGGLGQTSGAGFFTVTYAAAPVEAGAADVASFRSATVEIPVTTQNVTRITVSVECADPAAAAATAAPFTLQITVTPPAGIAAPEPTSGTCGDDVAVLVPVADLPAGGAVLGSTEDEARANLAASENATKAVGSWSVAVTGGRGGGPVPGLPTGAGDPGGRIVLTADQWSPTFVAAQGR